MSKEPHSFYLLNDLRGIPVDKPEDWLARVIRDYRQPRTAFTPAKPRVPTFTIDLDHGLQSVERALVQTKSRKIEATLSDILGISRENLKKNRRTFKARNVVHYRMTQEPEVLNARLADPEVDAKIKEWKLGPFEPLYFVVGFLMTNEITFDPEAVSGHAASATIDGSKAGMAIGQPIPPVKVNAERKGEQSTTGKTIISGVDRVFAIEYRAFRRHLRQKKPGHVATQGGYGPQGDGTFSSTEEMASDGENVVEFDEEPFSDRMEADGCEDECLVFDDSDDN